MQAKWNITPNQTILYGQSVGSAPTVHLAAMHKVAGVIIHSGFMSGLRVKRRTMIQSLTNHQNHLVANILIHNALHRWHALTVCMGAARRVNLATAAAISSSIFLTVPKLVRGRRLNQIAQEIDDWYIEQVSDGIFNIIAMDSDN